MENSGKTQLNQDGMNDLLCTTIQGRGLPMLCLHGHPGSKECMTVFSDRLSQRFQTIAPDLRGYGNSSAPAPFEMTAHLEDLQRLLDRLKISQCLVLGWSLGGILAMELALRCPDRIQGLILVATAARPRSNHPPVSWQEEALTGIASIVNWLSPGWDWNIEQFGKRSLYRYLIQTHQPQTYTYLANYALPAYLKTSKPARDALKTALRSRYDRLAELNAIRCPSLMLAAEGDRHITPESSQETATHLADCDWKLYANVAHLFPWEIPDQLLNDIEQWLAQREFLQP